MTQRTYNQYCPVAHALDLIGERWTLLIIRNLFLGPKRFSDLLRSLPGIGTNILTDRLKSLEENDLVQNRFLPPPAASSVYELTPYGRTLEDVMIALAMWGAQSLGARQPDQPVMPDSLALTIYVLFKPAAAKLSGTYAIKIEEESFNANFGVTVHEGIISVEQDVPRNPTLTLQFNLETLGLFVTRQLALKVAIAAGKVAMDGPDSKIVGFLETFEGI